MGRTLSLDDGSSDGISKTEESKKIPRMRKRVKMKMKKKCAILRV